MYVVLLPSHIFTRLVLMLPFHYWHYFCPRQWLH